MKTYSEMADSALRRIAQQRSVRKKRRKILTGCLAAVTAVGMGVVWLDPMFPPPTMQTVTHPTVPAPSPTEPIVTSTPLPSEENVGIDGCYAAYSLEDLIQGMGVVWLDPMFPPPTMQAITHPTVPAPSPTEPIVTSTPLPSEENVGIDGCYAAYSLEDLIQDADCIYQIRIESAQQLPSDTAYHRTTQYQAQVTGIYRGDALPGDPISGAGHRHLPWRCSPRRYHLHLCG